MPRHSAAKIALAPFLTETRLEPPKDLSTTERQAFIAIVNSVSPRHFAREDLALLRVLCTTIMLERHLAGRIAQAHKKGETAELARLGSAHNQTIGTLTRLHRVLRIGPMARSSTAHRRSPSDVVHAPAETKPQPWDEDESAPSTSDPRPWRQ